jgi:hypothetical protein
VYLVVVLQAAYVERDREMEMERKKGGGRIREEGGGRRREDIQLHQGTSRG